MELQLSREIASLSARFESFAKEAGRKLDSIDRQVRLTNGRVDALETVNSERRAVEDATLQATLTSSPITFAQMKVYVTLVLTTATLAIGAVLWVLSVAGILE